MKNFFADPINQDVFIGLLALITGILFVQTDLIYNFGSLAAPLDDVYIHLQYGRQIGEGHWFQYNSGDPISTGASSLLYAVILGGAYALGFHDSLLTFAVVLGVLLFGVTAVLGAKVGRLLWGRRAGVWAGTLIATNGAFVWGAASGMEISLLAALLMGTLLAFIHELRTGRFILTPILAALAALTRPEGLIFAAVLEAVILLRLINAVRERPSSLPGSLLNGLFSLLPLLAGAAQLLFYQLTTGTTAANGVQAKSLLYTPIFYPTEFLSQTMSNLINMTLFIFNGIDPGDYLFPGAVVFFTLGIAHSIFRGGYLRIAALMISIALALTMLSVATLITWNSHHYRYILPFFPMILLLAVAGFYSLNNQSLKLPWLPEALAGFALVLSLIGLPTWAVTLGENSGEIREQQISIGQWIKSTMPENARIGVNDVGAMRYYGDRPVVDLIGLTTNGLAEPYRNGVASTYEALERMRASKRPNYFIIYPDWFPNLDKSGILGEKVASFILSENNKIAGGREVDVYKANWKYVHSGRLPQNEPAGNIKDTLDVADLTSEGQHDYKMHLAQVGMQPGSALEKFKYPNGRTVVDGGRAINGSESFTVHNLSPNQEMKIVMRTTNTPFTLKVLVDGEDTGEWRFNPQGKGWHEPSYTIPAKYIRSDSLRIQLLPILPIGLAPLQTYTPFHYWFIQ